MLVLSRRLHEKIVLPGVDVTLQVLHVAHNQVKLGIEAPKAVKVLRGELQDDSPSEHESLSQALAGMLHKIGLSLQLLERQWADGKTEEAGATLAQVREQLASVSRDWIPKDGQDEKRHSKPKKAQPKKGTPKKKGAHKPRTLVVEDNSHERQLLAGFLEMNGHECPTAADGQEALDYLSRHNRPDFVLMDPMMLRLDGRHAMRKMRDDPRLRDLKIFAISNLPPQDTGPGGFDAWFTKPLNVAKLLEAIRKSQGDN